MGKRESINLSLHCHHQNDSCIKMGSKESHFNVSVGSDGQRHKTVSTNHNIFELRERRAEAVSNRGSSALPLGQTGSHTETGQALSSIPYRAAPASRWQAASDWREGVGGLRARNSS